MPYVCVKTIDHVLQYLPDLPFFHSFEPVQEIFYCGSLRQVAE